MDKFYKITNEKLRKEIEWYRETAKAQNNFIKQFFEENNIDGTEYYLRGTGMCNCEFQEDRKTDISLSISPTSNNTERFGKDFKQSLCSGLVALKKTSKLLKKFQDGCIQNKIVINLLRVRIGDYFKELHLGGFGTEGLHEHDGAFYLKIHTDHHDTITPEHEGFEEIKGSEYYQLVESLAR